MVVAMAKIAARAKDCFEKEQALPILEQLAVLPESLGQVEHLLADTGYYSADNVRSGDKHP